MGSLLLMGLGGAAGVPSGTVLLQDSFTDGDGTSLDAHTMDVGAGWTERVGVWEILTNKAVVTSNAGDYYHATAGAGQADYEVECDFTLPLTGPIDCAVVVRWATTTSYLAAILTSVNLLASSSLELYLRNPGFTLQGSAYAAGAQAGGNTINIRVKCVADQISVYLDDVLRIGPVTQATNQTAQIVGIQNYRGATHLQIVLDNFLAVTP